ncbi:hypothetical protein [Nocardioides sp. J54]|uniref:hypothetical protein n=1 Tax=Nocardioides sp. J54 TaxID=935866 RepID=UPI000684A0AB|nr:hypothetical protein [Nocardioides sp. J54]
MPAAADVPGMPEEFTGPVAYSDRWLWIGIALLVLVLAYYLVSWWVTRPPRVPTVPRRAVDVPDAQQQHLALIDDLAARVRSGDVGPREGHQQLSELVRSYVAAVSTLPARTMALADFRDRAPRELVEAIELMYPPEFAPDPADPLATFEDAVGRSRDLVSTWG